MRLTDIGWNDSFARSFAIHQGAGLTAGRVSLQHKGLYTILTEAGELPARPEGAMYYDAGGRGDLPVVGDWVAARVYDENPPKAVIHAVLPRKSIFSRKEPGARTSEQPLAANIDTVLIVIGLDGNFNVRRIERYLALAWESGANPIVVLTKADTCSDVDARLAQAQACAPGVAVHAISVIDGAGLESLAGCLLSGHTIALLGSSGTGKSTLVNHLLGKAVQRIQEVREADSRGRHTTTHRQMFILPSGALVIDTPGMRELQLWSGGDGLDTAFNDIDELAAGCRFADCSHQDEPGCAVKAAIDSGSLDPGRFANYVKMQKELAFLARRQDTSLEQIEKAKWKKIHKSIRDLYKDR